MQYFLNQVQNARRSSSTSSPSKALKWCLFACICAMTLFFNSCLVTEFSEPPATKKNPIQKPDPDIDSDIDSDADSVIITLPDYLANICTKKIVPDVKGSFHGVTSVTQYKNTNDKELVYWKDSLTALVYFKAPGPPCLQVLKELKAFESEFMLAHPNSGLQMIGLVTSSTYDTYLDEYLSETQVSFPIYRDSNWDFSNIYGTGYVPVLMVFDTYGNAWQITTSVGRVQALESLLLFLLD